MTSYVHFLGNPTFLSHSLILAVRIRSFTSLVFVAFLILFDAQPVLLFSNPAFATDTPNLEEFDSLMQNWRSFPS